MGEALASWVKQSSVLVSGPEPEPELEPEPVSELEPEPVSEPVWEPGPEWVPVPVPVLALALVVLPHASSASLAHRSRALHCPGDVRKKHRRPSPHPT
jgi:hypothetical protein